MIPNFLAIANFLSNEAEMQLLRFSVRTYRIRFELMFCIHIQQKIEQLKKAAGAAFCAHHGAYFFASVQNVTPEAIVSIHTIAAISA